MAQYYYFQYDKGTIKANNSTVTDTYHYVILEPDDGWTSRLILNKYMALARNVWVLENGELTPVKNKVKNYKPNQEKTAMILLTAVPFKK